MLADIDETAREKAKPRILPLRIKWALSMAAIIAVVMGISATLITQRQYEALMGQATDYGASLARFIARQNAAAALYSAGFLPAITHRLAPPITVFCGAPGTSG